MEDFKKEVAEFVASCNERQLIGVVILLDDSDSLSILAHNITVATAPAVLNVLSQVVQG